MPAASEEGELALTSWQDLVRMMISCWEPEPLRRPNFSTLAARITALIAEVVSRTSLRTVVDVAAGASLGENLWCDDLLCLSLDSRSLCRNCTEHGEHGEQRWWRDVGEHGGDVRRGETDEARNAGGKKRLDPASRCK
eukprot:41926-Hanusia_phi.AAC.1